MHEAQTTAICARCFYEVRLADAEYREVPMPGPDEPERTRTERLHPKCAALSDHAVEMGRKLAPAAESAGRAEL